MKKSVFFAFVLLCLMTLLCLSVGAEVFEGKAVDEQWIQDNEGSSGDFDDGDINKIAPYYRIWYRLDTDEGVLRIYYKGEEQKMLPYARFEWVPWLKTQEPNVQRPFILEAEIGEGVLTVGRYSFYQCENLHTVYLPSSIYKIDQTVFYECPSLETIYYAGTQEDFEKYVTFDKTRNDDALGKFVFGESVKVVAKNQHGEIFDEYIVGGYHAGDAYFFLPKSYEGMTYTGDATAAITGVYAENDQTVYELIYSCNHVYAAEPDGAPCITKCLHCYRSNPDDIHLFNEDNSVIPCVGTCLLCGKMYENINGSHSFAIDPESADAPCKQKCLLCGDPFYNKDGKHSRILIDEPSSLFHSGRSGWICSEEGCGAGQIEGENAIIFYVGIVAAVVAAGVVVFLAIFLPIRRHKKIKDMTW